MGPPSKGRAGLIFVLTTCREPRHTHPLGADSRLIAGEVTSRVERAPGGRVHFCGPPRDHSRVGRP